MRSQLFLRALTVLSIALLLSMLGAALHDMSRSWDVGYYHLPFAGRLAGILPESVYSLHPANKVRFVGYPILGELLQGVAWRITGRAEATNVIAWSAIPLFAFFLMRRHKVPFGLTATLLLAIPIVQLHATTSYVDLPGGAAGAVVVLTAIFAYAKPGSLDRRALAITLVCAAIGANMRFQLHPILLAALSAIALKLLLEGDTRGLIALIASGPIVFFSSVKNLLVHHNPYYPVRLSILGITLPGPEKPYDASPPYLLSYPRPVRFVASLLEIGLRPYNSTKHWTVDMWMEDDNGSRMGGFFHAFVIFNLALLVTTAIREKTSKDGLSARTAALGFAAFTLVVSILPQSHELRYYVVWMIALVGLNACLAVTPARRVLLGAGGLFALLFVAGVTQGGYLYASGTTSAGLVQENVDQAKLDSIQEGESVCIARTPWTVLWAAPFHPGRHYRVQEAEESSDCGASRPLP
jgi:hypothetical protein